MLSILFVSLCCSSVVLCTKNDDFNIILFLAKPDLPTTGTFKPTGLKYLGFNEKARVKHCDEEQGETAVGGGQYLNPGSDCSKLLKASLFSLISHCRNMVGMTTALACSENNTFTNGLRAKRSPSSRYHRDWQNYRMWKSTPLYFPRPRYFPGRSEPVITKPEHTEIFKIRSKRQDQLQNIITSTTSPLSHKNKDKNKYDILGVITTMTFFGKLLMNNEKSNQDEDGGTDLGMEQEAVKLTEPPSGTKPSKDIDENSFFDLVKETLSNVQETCEKGFLIVIIGGKLSETCDPYSSFVQAVKHVTENTDDHNTAIIVTGFCPEDDYAPESLIPVYMRCSIAGCEQIEQCTELYNLPYTIKNMIADNNVGGNYFTNMKSRRRVKREADGSTNTAEITISLTLGTLFNIIMVSVLL